MADIKSEIETDENGFEIVDLDDFIGEDNSFSRDFSEGIVVLTPKERDMVNDLKQKLTFFMPRNMEIFNRRMGDLQNLAASIAAFPSLLEKSYLTGGARTPEDIVNFLVTDLKDGDTTLQLPSKATLGRGFLVAKIHTFGSLTKLATESNLDKNLVKAFYDETASMMFLLLSEDVYLNIVRDETVPIQSRRQLAWSLLLLWEHRADQNIADISPVLRTVWNARRTLAPAFGTMMGTSELLLISMQMDDIWGKFITSKLSDPETTQAMEEFLFGISYEQILKLRATLREKGIPAVGRDEISDFLGESVITDVRLDYKDFFTQYSLRRDNARARKRQHLPGPHRTLEDLFVRYIMEQNREKQEKDKFAGEEN